MLKNLSKIRGPSSYSPSFNVAASSATFGGHTHMRIDRARGVSGKCPDPCASTIIA